MLLQRLPRVPVTLRGCRATPIQAACGVTVRVHMRHQAQRRWASEGKKDSGAESPFYLQLNESIFERVQKEKEEQLQVQFLQQRTARGQFFATVAGRNPAPAPAGPPEFWRLSKNILLTGYSMSSHRWHWLLFWPDGSPQAKHRLDRASAHLSSPPAQHLRSKHGGCVGGPSRHCGPGQYFAR